MMSAVGVVSWLDEGGCLVFLKRKIKNNKMTKWAKFLRVVLYSGSVFLFVGSTYLLFVKEYTFYEFISAVMSGFIAFIFGKDGKIVLFEKK
ncbi:hypothetical protein HMPREF0204_11384 [Chryseobacterium gleum ATCC 35910]|nr:hypothetical protein HMPREF0204_11384 [Chryseobacterium gleum ATCC 35910]